MKPSAAWILSMGYTNNTVEEKETLQSDFISTVSVGGIEAGTTFPVGTSEQTLWNNLLRPSVAPTFVNPSVTLSTTAPNYSRAGTSIDNAEIIITYDAGSIDIQGTKQANRGGEATSYIISTNGADVEYSYTNTTGVFTIPNITRANKGDVTIYTTVEYAEGVQPKDSSGNDYGTPLPAGSINETMTISFILPFYYGVSSTTSVSDFSSLTEYAMPKDNMTFEFSTANEHMVFAYDSSYGDLSSILDQNSFETISGWSKSTLTVDGYEYFVYVADSATTDTSAKFTFMF